MTVELIELKNSVQIAQQVPPRPIRVWLHPGRGDHHRARWAKGLAANLRSALALAEKSHGGASSKQGPGAMGHRLTTTLMYSMGDGCLMKVFFPCKVLLPGRYGWV